MELTNKLDCVINAQEFLYINSLEITDDLAILAKDIQSATRKINLFKETAQKAGLQLPFRKTEYITNIKMPLKLLRSDYGKIKNVEKFKYLGEIV